MIGRLLVLAALVGFSQQDVFENCSCGGKVATTDSSAAAYCPVNTVSSCNATALKEQDCTITCDGGPRVYVAYRNGTTAWQQTTSIKCEDGKLTNGAGAAIPPAYFQRPTCAYMASCSKCPFAEEKTFCPANYTCNPVNLKHYIDTDGCDRIGCDNDAKLTLYDATGAVMPFTAQKLYCTQGFKWANFSSNGAVTGGVAVNGTFTANCRLPAICETCLELKTIKDWTEMPLPFQNQSVYAYTDITVVKQTAQCTKAVCPAGYQVYGFVGNDTNQNPTNFTNQNWLKCDLGLWTNGGMNFLPAAMKVACGRKITPCGIVDNVSGTAVVTCDAQTKVASVTCPTGKKLSMITAVSSQTAKFDRATFFPGKGWLAHGCDATATLFATSAGLEIGAYCV